MPRSDSGCQSGESKVKVNKTAKTEFDDIQKMHDPAKLLSNRYPSEILLLFIVNKDIIINLCSTDLITV